MITMAQYWTAYWRQVLAGITIAFILSAGTGLVMAFKIYYQVQEIQKDVDQLDWIRLRQEAHEVALIQLADHTEMSLKQMMEILNSSPYRESGNYDDLNNNPNEGQN